MNYYSSKLNMAAAAALPIIVTPVASLMGFGVSVYQIFVLAGFIWMCVAAWRYNYIAVSIVLYVLAMAFTSLLAGYGIESGGYLRETGFTGVENLSFYRLYLYYIAFILSYILIFSPQWFHEVGKWSSGGTVYSSNVGVIFGLAISGVICISGALAGIFEGFALLDGVNRYYIRNSEISESTGLFNFYLNNRTFAAMFLGGMISIKYSRYLMAAWILIVLMILLSIMHGEQFMAVLQIFATIFIPAVIFGYSKGRFNHFHIGVVVIFVLTIALASMLYAYQSQGLNTNEMFDARFLLQGQLWYVVDLNATLWHPVSSRGYNSILNAVVSFFDWENYGFKVEFGKMTGIREIMFEFGVPEIVSVMADNGVTFTMGQMAVPVYWFGYIGALVFTIFVAMYIGLLSRIIVRTYFSGGIISLFVVAKIYGNSIFALQQGDYWYIFGIRNLIFLLIALILIEFKGSFSKIINLGPLGGEFKK